MTVGVLDGKVAIVTGSNRGIGRGIARGFAREGARLALAARDAALLKEAAEEFQAYGGDVVTFPTDVTVETEVDALIDQTVAHFGHLDVLVNNAGIARHTPVVDMELSDWQATLDTNLTGPFLCARAALRVMTEARHGRIINVASISSQRVRPNSASYSASKFGRCPITSICLRLRCSRLTNSLLVVGRKARTGWVIDLRFRRSIQQHVPSQLRGQSAPTAHLQDRHDQSVHRRRLAGKWAVEAVGPE